MLNLNFLLVKYLCTCSVLKPPDRVTLQVVNCCMYWQALERFVSCALLHVSAGAFKRSRKCPVPIIHIVARPKARKLERVLHYSMCWRALTHFRCLDGLYRQCRVAKHRNLYWHALPVLRRAGVRKICRK
jgi:hypothetical protein